MSIEAGLALFATCRSTETSGAYTGAIGGKALGIIVALTALSAGLAELVYGTWSGTVLPIPAGLTHAGPGPWVTHVSVLGHTLADILAGRSIEAFGTRALGAVLATPAIGTLASAGHLVTHAAIFATARHVAIYAPCVLCTSICTLTSHVTGRTNTFAGHVITLCSIVAFTARFTFFAPHSCWTSVTTHISHPSRSTDAFAGSRVTAATILTSAVILTVRSMLSVGAFFFAQRSSESRFAEAFPGDMMTGASIHALARFLAILAIVLAVAFLATLRTSKSLWTHTLAIGWIADRVVLTGALLVTVGTPEPFWASYVARRPSVSIGTLASVRSGTRPMNTFRQTHRNTPVILRPGISCTAFLHWSGLY